MKKVMPLLFIAVCLLTACTKAPSNAESKKIAVGYLNNFIPEATEDKISIAKSYEKEGNTIVVFQAGQSMVCEMAVLKGKDGWIGRGIDCSGEFYTPEQKKVSNSNTMAKNNLRNLVNDLQNYYNENQKYPTDLESVHRYTYYNDVDTQYKFDGTNYEATSVHKDSTMEYKISLKEPGVISQRKKGSNDQFVPAPEKQNVK